MNGSTLGAFLAGSLVVMSLPGPSVLYAMSHTLEAGRAAGLVSVLGLEVALAMHVAVATTGLGALLVASPVALSTLRYLGAGYLAHLGVKQLRRAGPVVVSASEASCGRPLLTGRGRAFRQACLVDLLNPGTALFLVAFLPQFVDARSGSPAAQLLVLGLLVVLVATVCDISWVLATAHLGRPGGHLRRLAGHGSSAARRIVGAMYLVLAVLVLLV